MTVRL